VKDRLKRALFSLGFLPWFHAARNRRHLTVAMFHRVLSVQDERWHAADPAYTVSVDLFEQCVLFFKKHYHVVTVDQVMRAHEQGGTLPSRALLITIDDGWADTEQYAAPILSRHGLPAVVFVAAATVDSQELFWEEALVAASRTGSLTEHQLCELAQAAGVHVTNPPIADLIARLKSKPDARRIASAILGTLQSHPQPMMSTAQLQHLGSDGIAIGGHGASHTPLTVAPAPAEELAESRRMLGALTEKGCACAPVMSFPHGARNPQVVRMAFESGFKLLFTSDPYLNVLSNGRPASGILGRIEIPAGAIQDRSGRWRRDLLALWLFTRPARASD